MYSSIPGDADEDEIGSGLFVARGETLSVRMSKMPPALGRNMLDKRQLLEIIDKKDLLALVDEYELFVIDRRAKKLAIDALDKSRSVEVAELVSKLSRDALLKVCRNLGLDGSGGSKSELAARLLKYNPEQAAAAAVEAPAAAPTKPKKRGKAKGRATRESKDSKGSRESKDSRDSRDSRDAVDTGDGGRAAVATGSADPADRAHPGPSVKRRRGRASKVQGAGDPAPAGESTAAQLTAKAAKIPKKASESAAGQTGPVVLVRRRRVTGPGDDAAASPVATRPPQTELPLRPTLTRKELESHLWTAADILRGSVDSIDYKNYIFGLLFLKRLSDVFEEEARELIAAGMSKQAARNSPNHHSFFVPRAARFAHLLGVDSKVGEALDNACSILEARNPKLRGALVGIGFADPRNLGDQQNRDAVLGRLVRHFATISLGNADLSEPDMLGRAYQYLIERFADDAGKKGGEFYTPRMVVQLMVALLAPREIMSICDPTAGSGGMLIECASYVQRKGGDELSLTLHGQEKNPRTWALCKMNLLLHGLVDARIEQGDVIRAPKLVDGGQLITYDRVIANPPFSLDDWGIEAAKDDPFGRFRLGIPPRSKGDLAFVQHMVSTLNQNGRLAVVVPHGILFRGGSEGEIRRALIEEKLFEAVIGLPANLFYGTTIPTAILVLNRSKAASRLGKILFIDASEEYEAAKNQNHLRPQDAKKIVSTYRTFKDVKRYARVVSVAEVAENDFNLSLNRYVDTRPEEEKIDIGQAVATLRQLEQERTMAEERMNRFLVELGYGDR